MANCCCCKLQTHSLGDTLHARFARRWCVDCRWVCCNCMLPSHSVGRSVNRKCSATHNGLPARTTSPIRCQSIASLYSLFAASLAAFNRVSGICNGRTIIAVGRWYLLCVNRCVIIFCNNWIGWSVHVHLNCSWPRIKSRQMIILFDERSVSHFVQWISVIIGSIRCQSLLVWRTVQYIIHMPSYQS